MFQKRPTPVNSVTYSTLFISSVFFCYYAILMATSKQDAQKNQHGLLMFNFFITLMNTFYILVDFDKVSSLLKSNQQKKIKQKTSKSFGDEEKKASHEFKEEETTPTVIKDFANSMSVYILLTLFFSTGLWGAKMVEQLFNAHLKNLVTTQHELLISFSNIAVSFFSNMTANKYGAMQQQPSNPLKAIH